MPHLALADVSPKLDELRWVKTAYEVERLRRSGRIGAAAVAEAIKGTRPGMYEYEIAAAAQYVNTRLGARGDAFPPIVPSGPARADRPLHGQPPADAGGELVYMDYGSDYEYYTSDITRTWPVSGKFTAEQEKMYRCVLEARNAIIAAMKPGATIESLQEVAAAGLRAARLRQGVRGQRAVHRALRGDRGARRGRRSSGRRAEKPFVAGTVFNVEPILEIPDRKIHIRLEDTVLVTDTGAENVTAGVPAEIEPLYALIRQRGVNSAPLCRRASRDAERRGGGSRSRTAWPRLREPGTAESLRPSEAWMRDR